MAIRFRRVSRLCDPTNKELGKKVYPVISYQYDTSATLTEIAKEICDAREHTRLAHGLRTEHTRSAVSVIRRNDIEPLAYQTREERLRPGSGIHP